MEPGTPKFVTELEHIKQIAPTGTRYFHYKNPSQFYTIVSHGIIEATEETAIIYQADYDAGIIWIRPTSVFLEEVEWQGKKVPRFTRMN